MLPRTLPRTPGRGSKGGLRPPSQVYSADEAEKRVVRRKRGVSAAE